MSFWVWTELVCRGCATTLAGRFTQGPIRRREMKNEATRHGWIFDKESEDWFCATCKRKPRDDDQDLSDGEDD